MRSDVLARVDTKLAAVTKQWDERLTHVTLSQATLAADMTLLEEGVNAFGDQLATLDARVNEGYAEGLPLACQQAVGPWLRTTLAAAPLAAVEAVRDAGLALDARRKELAAAAAALDARRKELAAAAAALDGDLTVRLKGYLLTAEARRAFLYDTVGAGAPGFDPQLAARLASSTGDAAMLAAMRADLRRLSAIAVRLAANDAQAAAQTARIKALEDGLTAFCAPSPASG